MIYLKVDSLFEIRNRLFIIIFFVSCFSKNNSYYQWLFFKKALQSFHAPKPNMITVDKNPVYPIAIESLKREISH